MKRKDTTTKLETIDTTKLDQVTGGLFGGPGLFGGGGLLGLRNRMQDAGGGCGGGGCAGGQCGG